MDAESSTHDLSESVIQSNDDSKLGTELDRSLAEKAATLAWRTSRDRTSSSVGGMGVATETLTRRSS